MSLPRVIAVTSSPTDGGQTSAGARADECEHTGGESGRPCSKDKLRANSRRALRTSRMTSTLLTLDPHTLLLLDSALPSTRSVDSTSSNTLLRLDGFKREIAHDGCALSMIVNIIIINDRDNEQRRCPNRTETQTEKEERREQSDDDRQITTVHAP